MDPRRDGGAVSSASTLSRRATDAASRVTFALLANSDGPPVFVMSSAGAPLAALAGGALARRFRFWQGASGRRYICSIFPLPTGGEAESLPDYSGVVVVAVAGPAGQRKIAFVTSIEDAPERRWATMRDLRGIAELHVHLLAGVPAQRRQICVDLSAAHGCPCLHADFLPLSVAECC
jgi:hypothetical protein